MTISTSSSARRRLPFALSALALVAGCNEAGSAPAQQPKRTSPVKAANAAPADPAKLYTADLTRAVAGAKKAPFTSAASFGRMTCAPPAIGGTSAASRALTLTLPAAAAARAHVLAVVTPERGLLEIYSPLAEGTETEDVVIPSDTISWAKAKGQQRFVTNSDALDGLRPGADTPEAVFIEPGRYRFALVNGIDGALLKANGTAVKVFAACSFGWTP